MNIKTQLMQRRAVIMTDSLSGFDWKNFARHAGVFLGSTFGLKEPVIFFRQNPDEDQIELAFSFSPPDLAFFDRHKMAVVREFVADEFCVRTREENAFIPDEPQGWETYTTDQNIASAPEQDEAQEEYSTVAIELHFKRECRAQLLNYWSKPQKGSLGPWHEIIDQFLALKTPLPCKRGIVSTADFKNRRVLLDDSHSHEGGATLAFVFEIKDPDSVYLVQEWFAESHPDVIDRYLDKDRLVDGIYPGIDFHFYMTGRWKTRGSPGIENSSKTSPTCKQQAATVHSRSPSKFTANVAPIAPPNHNAEYIVFQLRPDLIQPFLSGRADQDGDLPRLRKALLDYTKNGVFIVPIEGTKLTDGWFYAEINPGQRGHSKGALIAVLTQHQSAARSWREFQPPATEALEAQAFLKKYELPRIPAGGGEVILRNASSSTYQADRGKHRRHS